MPPPDSFDEDLMTDWSVWVLDHDLPDLPADVEIGESVPVARWAGPRLGAVLHLQWSWSDDHDSDYLATEVEVFRRTADGGWEVANPSGGSDWPSEWPLRRPDVSPDYVTLGGQFSFGDGDWTASTFDGIAGVNATTVEVTDSDGITRRPLDSPLGIVLAVVDGASSAIVRVLDAQGRVLKTQSYDGYC